MGTKAQGSNTKWLRSSLKKCHATEVEVHNKWVQCNAKGKMNLELCRRAGKVALKMCKRSQKRLETRAALSARASKVAIDMCSKKKDEYKQAAEPYQPKA